MYLLGDVLGTGTYGEVRICFSRTDPPIRRAVKICYLEGPMSQQMKTMLHNEV